MKEMEVKQEDAAVGNGSTDDTGSSNLEIQESSFSDILFHSFAESFNLEDFLEKREILLNAQSVTLNDPELEGDIDVLPSYFLGAAERRVLDDTEENIPSFAETYNLEDMLEERDILHNGEPFTRNDSELERKIDVLSSYSVATARIRVIDDTEENISSSFSEVAYLESGENFQNSLKALENSARNKTFGNFAEIKSCEEFVPHESPSTFQANPLGILPSDISRGSSEDHKSLLNEHLTLQKLDRSDYSGLMSQERPASDQKENINGRRRNLSFKSNPGKTIRHPVYTSVSKTVYTPKTSNVGPKTKNKGMDNMENHKSRHCMKSPLFEQSTHHNGCSDVETRNNEEPSISCNEGVVYTVEPSGIGSVSMDNGDLVSDKRRKRSAQTIHDTDSNQRSFSCSKCDKTFHLKHNLNRHLVTHRGENRFVCSECGKKYRRKDILSRHLLTHRGEKRFVCSKCGKKYGRKDILNAHLLTHSEEKSFKCDECGKTFLHKRKLENHLRIHTGEKPFECKFCKKGYALRYSLYKHLRTHSFKCDV